MQVRLTQESHVTVTVEGYPIKTTATDGHVRPGELLDHSRRAKRQVVTQVKQIGGGAELCRRHPVRRIVHHSWTNTDLFVVETRAGQAHIGCRQIDARGVFGTFG
ncbi:hypothetical protein D3C86_1440220 [compost metagenome]